VHILAPLQSAYHSLPVSGGGALRAYPRLLSRPTPRCKSQECQKIPSQVRIEEGTPEMREEAWRLFSQHRDKNYDLIDCISFSIMASFSIRVVFGFDRHFIQYGFRLLPD
jgi:hypothetical protein